jgi:hypothetical protein
MLVYGDLERAENAGEIAREVEDRLVRCRQIPAGLQRHQALIGAFIRASELVQGAADAEFQQVGFDDVSGRADAGNELLLALAKSVAASWDSGFAALSYSPDQFSPHLALLGEAGTINSRQAEGYAFYALYPESYIAAARRSGLGPDTLVIGIRSIGAGLGALVAAGLEAQAAMTVRPVGHPFNRQLALGKDLAQRLADHEADLAIVDEGPGLSGSSFNCVADWLVAQGVSEARIHFFPSHAGDLGSAARAEHRQRWQTASRHFVSFEQLLLHPDEPVLGLERWISDIVGPLKAPLRDISGGAWRQELGVDLPADPAMERRKFLAATKSKKWLGKFVGIGGKGEEKLELARVIGEACFAPRPVGLCHGFLLYPWVEAEQKPGETVPPERLLDYLAFRASLPPTGPGASPKQLFEMAIFNIGQHFGDASKAVHTALGDPQHLHPIPCCTDNRMHTWEWLKSGQTWLKLDATDHQTAHDLVGCQDIAWDLAGAAVEMDMSETQRNALILALGHRIGRLIESDFVAAMELCYLGFQIGLWSMAQGRNNQAEGGRIKKLLARYGRHRALRSLGINL